MRITIQISVFTFTPLKLDIEGCYCGNVPQESKSLSGSESSRACYSL